MADNSQAQGASRMCSAHLLPCTHRARFRKGHLGKLPHLEIKLYKVLLRRVGLLSCLRLPCTWHKLCMLGPCPLLQPMTVEPGELSGSCVGARKLLQQTRRKSQSEQQERASGWFSKTCQILIIGCIVAKPWQNHPVNNQDSRQSCVAAVLRYLCHGRPNQMTEATALCKHVCLSAHIYQLQQSCAKPVQATKNLQILCSLLQ